MTEAVPWNTAARYLLWDRDQRSVACIIATNAAPRELFWRPNRHARFGIDDRSALQQPRECLSARNPMYGVQGAAAADVPFG
jgi:hypothetical protein